MNKALVLLSGEDSSIPEAEARALFLTYDVGARFTVPERRVLIVESSADPYKVSKRIAFARRVGLMISNPIEAAETVQGKTVRFRSFAIGEGTTSPLDVTAILGGLDAEIDLEDPFYEFTLVQGKKEYLMLSRPGAMNQGWSLRRPRKRAFFHPSAIFPKLSRALVNLTRCREGDIFLDPFAGTGSLPIEASSIGLKTLSSDQSRKMVKGALSNMRALGQEWLGILRADALNSPFRQVDGIATDVPYGRASSTQRSTTKKLVDETVGVSAGLLRAGRRLVLMHPKSVRVEETRELIEDEQHEIYVHRKLTRTITVLRRT